MGMQIKVLGITLSDCTLREALRLTEHYLVNGALNTIAYISTDKLVKASEDPEQKKWIEELDLTVCEDIEVLHAAGITSKSRIREVEDNEYLTEFLRRIKHNKNGILLLSDTAENLEKLEDDLRDITGTLPIRGRISLEEYGDNKEGIVNAMNVITPAVILSRMPYIEGMKMMHEYKMLLNAELWIALPEHMAAIGSPSLLHKIRQKISKRQFLKMVKKFQDDLFV